ncbi:hypothetical protein AAAC51_06445 [Priestia megaterium]
MDCVDNNATRVFIHETIQQVHKSFPGIFSLSSGNEFLNGQVVCGCTPGFSFYNHEEYQDFQLFRTPTVTEMFPEILEGEISFLLNYLVMKQLCRILKTL